MKKNLITIISSNSEPLAPISTKIIKKIDTPVFIKSIIFDIYGTLLISASGEVGTVKGIAKSEIFINSLKKSGIKICDNLSGDIGIKYFFNRIKQLHQISNNNKIKHPEIVITEIWEQTLKMLLKEKLIKTEISTKIIFKTAIYFEMFTNPVWPMPNLLKVLDILNEKNILLGIVSNAQFYTPLIFNALLNKSLKELGFSPELIEYSYLNMEAKPSQKMFNSVLSNLKKYYNVNPSETLYIGNDMLNDIYSAQITGFKTALFAGDMRSLKLRKNIPEIAGINPDFIITDLMQIPKLIK